MTPTSQRERCGHYPVCYLIGMQTGCIADECHEVCEHDTRSRPHALAPEGVGKYVEGYITGLKKRPELSEKCLELVKIAMLEGIKAGKSEAARAATLAENKRVLAAMQELSDLQTQTKGFHSGWMLGMALDQKIESLRLTGDEQP